MFANPASMTSMREIFITRECKGLKKTTERLAPGVSKSLVPQVCREGGEAVGGCSGRRM